MPIVEAVIAREIKKVLDDNKETDAEAGKQYFADGMASAIANAIKSGLVTVPAGIAVQVAFPVGTGATIAPGTGTIS